MKLLPVRDSLKRRKGRTSRRPIKANKRQTERTVCQITTPNAQIMSRSRHKRRTQTRNDPRSTIRELAFLPFCLSAEPGAGSREPPLPPPGDSAGGFYRTGARAAEPKSGRFRAPSNAPRGLNTTPRAASDRATDCPRLRPYC
jgi:hypothetical protein